MTELACQVIHTLAGKTLATAESCTGGLIGGALTAVSGSSKVYKGGIISYCNAVKNRLLAVNSEILEEIGPVSAPVAKAMAAGAREALQADIAVSVTGLAGPGGDEYGNPEGRVFIGYSDGAVTLARKFLFRGSRQEIRRQAVDAALALILDMQKEGAC